MKLNPDCVRDVLLSVEKLHQVIQLDNGVLQDEPTKLEAICSDLPEYSKADIFYTLKMLDDGGFVVIDPTVANGGFVLYCNVYGLTFSGHEFMQNIKDKDNWSAVKKVLGGIRNYSLSAISSVAEGVTNAAIKSFFSETNT